MMRGAFAPSSSSAFRVAASVSADSSSMPAASAAARSGGYDIGQNFTSALAIGAAAIVCTLALLAFYFCRYVAIGENLQIGGSNSSSNNSSEISSGYDHDQDRGSNRALLHLEELPVVGIEELAGRKVKGGEACAVCLTEFVVLHAEGQVSDSGKLRFLPQCGHCFHCECVDEWLKKHMLCPLCRRSLAVTDSVKEQSPALPPAQSDQELLEPQSEVRINIVEAQDQAPGALEESQRQQEQQSQHK